MEDLLESLFAFLRNYAAPINATYGLSILLFGLVNRSLRGQLHEQKEHQRGREEYIGSLQSTKQRLEDDLEDAKKCTAQYWLETARAGEQIESDLLPEFNPSVLQEGLVAITNPTQALYLCLAQERAVMYEKTGDRFQLQEAERLVRIATLMCPGDPVAAAWLSDIQESIAMNEFERGSYNPDDPRLFEDAQDQFSGQFVDAEGSIVKLMERGQAAFGRGHWRIAERLLNHSRRLAMNTLGSRTPLVLAARSLHLGYAALLGLYDFCQGEADLLVEDCDLGLGKEDPITLAVRYWQAQLLDSLGRYEEALTIVNEALPIVERTLGKEHFITLGARCGQAQILDSLGRSEEALAIVNEVLTIVERTLGKEHPIALRARYVQAQILDSLGRYEEALTIVNEVLPIAERTLGKEHPITLMARYVQAQLLDNLGRYEEALTIVNEVLPIEERILGKEHPEAAATRSLQAQILHRRGSGGEVQSTMQDQKAGEA